MPRGASRLKAMIYTVGLAERYDPMLRVGMAVKLGRREANGAVQHGGWVWQTPEEARRYLLTRREGALRKVYAVLAEWHLDTYEAAGEPTRCLLRDAHIIAEVAPAGIQPTRA